MSTPFRVKAGVQWFRMDARVEQALDKMAATWLRVTAQPLVITSGRDGEHSATSLHYEGRALDVRTRTLTGPQQEQVATALRTELGADWDVVIEKHHIHIELDRRADA